MGLIKRMKKNKKGFTLVELIVVLVILAILAAIAVPTFNSYIKKAKDKTVAAEARTVLLAANTLVAEANGESDSVNAIDKGAVAELAGVTESDITTLTVKDGELEALVYTKSGVSYTYDPTTHKMKSGTKSDAGKN